MPDNTQVLPGQFMHINKELRDYIAEKFNVARSGVTEVRDQDIVASGHTVDDLKVITLEEMCKYIGSEESFARAWELTCAKAWSELHPPIGVIKSATQIENETDALPKSEIQDEKTSE